MESIELDSRLKALLPVIEEMKGLRSYLEQAGRGRSDGVTFAPEIKWIDDTLTRLAPHLHARRWPPVWWRLGKVDIHLLWRNFHRVDNEGAYFDRTKPDVRGAYIAERENILNWIDRIKKMYDTASTK